MVEHATYTGDGTTRYLRAGHAHTRPAPKTFLRGIVMYRMSAAEPHRDFPAVVLREGIAIVLEAVALVTLAPALLQSVFPCCNPPSGMETASSTSGNESVFSSKQSFVSSSWPGSSQVQLSYC